ncbi:outer membrane beta-barrel protein [Hufsiella ginkgonis]|uniref:Outer membrane beta-barrel protein n=1 Tax=Hufsiella ginkgonis TaxID=2695274 RepID=A0A7K1XTC7_9SPHI|nr:outer membrane beta-barrel protein [Hufsiella ginkgonis]MXV14067.1 outer membrane beta-barrel protein [Hufsiella ginkgonis]
MENDRLVSIGCGAVIVNTKIDNLLEIKRSMKFIFLFLMLNVFSMTMLAQNGYSIKGSVTDTSQHIKLTSASVSVLHSEDSTIVKFTLTKADGSFSIANLPAGAFMLLISYHDYADHSEQFNLGPGNAVKDFGEINMMLKSRLLQEIAINGTPAVRMKGDTTEYNAGSYKTQPNDRVEDLLRQLPGVQVDEKGNITARGKQVSRVLLEGEEFFGDDPSLVTKNIRADMVNKVQLFDKRSDQAALTGVDDGAKERTINITLKEDKKRGYFGRSDGGLAAGYYQGQVMFNAFRSKQKFSAYGTIGNTNRTGLGSLESNKYGITPLRQGDMLESFNGTYTGEGLPSTKTGGLHYDKRWGGDKQYLNMNYKIGTINVTGTKNTRIQNNLPGGAIYTGMAQENDNTNFRHKLDATYQAALSPSSTLKLGVSGALANSRTGIGSTTRSVKDNQALLNTQARNLANDADQAAVSLNALWNRKFQKAGRTMSFAFSQAYNELQARGYLYSLNSFYGSSGAAPDSTQTIDQYKLADATSLVTNGNLTWSEPFSRNLALVLNYGLNMNSNTSDSRSFNPSAPGRYDLADTVYSNNFKRNLLSNQAGAVFSYHKGKTVFNFGSRVSRISDKQTDLRSGRVYDRWYWNWNPQVVYQNRSFLLGYEGSARQPTIDQLQPLKVNTDPLNILLGNPGLKPSYTSSFVYEHQLILGSGAFVVFLSSAYSFINNAITTSIATDAAGKSVLRYVNLEDKKPTSLSVAMEMGKELTDPEMRIGFGLNMDGDNYYNLTNKVLNKTGLWNYAGTISVMKTAVKKYGFRLSVYPGYVVNQSSVQNGAANNGWSVRADGSLNLYLPGKMQVDATANYRFQERTQAFNQDFSRLLLTTTFTRKFFKSEDLSLNLTVNDLLNQNKGIARSTGSGPQSAGNIFSQTEYNTIKRYFMLSVVWDFNRMGGPPSNAK